MSLSSTEFKLETISGHCFSSCFPDSNIEDDDKVGGVQLGIQLKVTFKKGEKRKYRIKTHSAGRLASNSAAAKSVDPMELMVYKLLERL